MIDHDIALEEDDSRITGFAFDRSARVKDADGRMRVEACRISKSNVCQYIGYEVPGHEALGLDPNRIYNLYRDRAALKAAAPSFSNVPLLIEHAAVSATEPRKQLVVGTVSNVRYEHPYLVADLMCWDAEAIRLIESGAQRELSCGYAYRADMTPGRIDGQPFDGRLLDIRGNHVAIVATGRAGPDVAVGDHAPMIPMHTAFADWNRLSRR